jgi:hypothetical protein
MKSLDLYVRRRSPPLYGCPTRPSDAVIALLYLTELRYESFTPNHVRTVPTPAAAEEASNNIWTCRVNKKHKRSKFEFSEPINLIVHAGFFTILQTVFPQSNPTVLAVQILLAIYVVWESLQLMLRYRTSPPLFNPLYTATSLSTFWSQTWHGAFASPCRSLAYDPLRHRLRAAFGIPASIAEAIGVIASFTLMGFFHVYGLSPLLPMDALIRVSVFFVLNGVGTVIEKAIWGRRKHWGKTLLAWVFELAIASWTVEGLSVPNGLRNIAWSNVCDIGKDLSPLFG